MPTERLKRPRKKPRLDFWEYDRYRGSAVLDERGHVVGTTAEAERRLNETRSIIHLGEGQYAEFERSDGAAYMVGIWREHANCGHQLMSLHAPDGFDPREVVLAKLRERRVHAKKRRRGSSGPASASRP